MAPKECPKAWSAKPHEGFNLVHHEAESKAERFAKYDAKLRKLLREAQRPKEG